MSWSGVRSRESIAATLSEGSSASRTTLKLRGQLVPMITRKLCESQKQQDRRERLHFLNPRLLPAGRQVSPVFQKPCEALEAVLNVSRLLTNECCLDLASAVLG